MAATPRTSKGNLRPIRESNPASPGNKSGGLGIKMRRLVQKVIILTSAWCISPCWIQMNNFFLWRLQPDRGLWPPHSRGFRDHTQRHTTVGRTPLDEWSALYLTTHNTHNRQTSTPPSGIQILNPASKQPQNHTLDGAATGIGTLGYNTICCLLIYSNVIKYASLNDFLVVLSGILEDGRQGRYRKESLNNKRIHNSFMCTFLGCITW